MFLTHTPGVNAFFSMEPMAGLQWLRVFVCMAIVYFIVEIEKALVDPVLMPFIKPVLRWCEARTPQCLSVDQPLSARLAHMCGGKHLAATASKYKLQKTGRFPSRVRRASSDGGKGDRSSHGGGGGGEEAAGVQPEEAPGAREVNRRLSAVVERAHSEHVRESTH